MSMSVQEMISVVTADLHHQITVAGLWLFGGALLVVLFAACFAPVLDWVRRHRACSVWLSPFVIGVIGYGSTKERRGNVSFPYTSAEVRYLTDDGSYTTNDYIHIQFTRSYIVPVSAWFWVEGCPISITNQSEWVDNAVLAYSNQFSGVTLPLDVYYPAATGYNWIVYTDWTPGPTTHTNGVAYVSWQIGVGKGSNELVTVKTGIYMNSARLAPNPWITNSPPISFSIDSIPGNQED